MSLQVFAKMSRDKKLVYLLCIGIEEGDISKVYKWKIGHMHQARWLTFAARLLRLYCSLPDEFGAYVVTILERMANFIINVYYKVRLNKE